MITMTWLISKSLLLLGTVSVQLSEAVDTWQMLVSQFTQYWKVLGYYSEERNMQTRREEVMEPSTNQREFH